MKMAEVVAEPAGASSTDVKDVGIAFVREYYTTAVTNVNGVLNMFGDDSVYIGDAGDEHYGQQDIRGAIASLNLHGGKVRIFSVGTAPVGSGGIIIQVFAAYVGDSCEYRFTETFYLSQQKLAKYYVRSTIFKWIDQPPPVMVATPLDFPAPNGQNNRVTLENINQSPTSGSHNDSLPEPENTDEAQAEPQKQEVESQQVQAQAPEQQTEQPKPIESVPADSNVAAGKNAPQNRRNSRPRRHRGTPSPKDGNNGRKQPQKVDENTAARENEVTPRDNSVVNGTVGNGANGNTTHQNNAPNQPTNTQPLASSPSDNQSSFNNKKPLGPRTDNRGGAPRTAKPNTTIHVAGLEKRKPVDRDALAADLKNIFGQFGEIVRVNVPMRCFNEEFSHAFAFVEFATRDSIDAIFTTRQIDNRGRVVLTADVPSLGHSGSISIAENRERTRFNGPPNSAHVRNARNFPDHRNGKGNHNGVPQKAWKAAY